MIKNAPVGKRRARTSTTARRRFYDRMIARAFGKPAASSTPDGVVTIGVGHERSRGMASVARSIVGGGLRHDWIIASEDQIQWRRRIGEHHDDADDGMSCALPPPA